jgi:small-conductance mechanosensitive channel
VEWLNQLTSELGADTMTTGVRVAALLLLGLLGARLLAGLVGRIVARRGTAQQVMVARRATFYLIVILVGLSILRQLGLDLSVLLGAAGILTVAIGFASQTSASNVISGVFLLGEQPFVVGDVIRVGATTGQVLSIDLLSVKLRTFENLYVRVPNESLIKSEITNLTRFPIRRIDLMFQVAYREDLERVQGVLSDLADRTHEVLEEPPPTVNVSDFADSGVALKFSIWVRTQGWYDFRTVFLTRIKHELDEAGIEIPFPHLSLYAGSASDPIRVETAPARP